MKKRLFIGLLAAVLLGAMLPGVAAAHPIEGDYGNQFKAACGASGGYFIDDDAPLAYLCWGPTELLWDDPRGNGGEGQSRFAQVCDKSGYAWDAVQGNPEDYMITLICFG